MSLVGTRPPTVDEWDKYELHHRARLATKPGLTGMWQVSGRSNITDLVHLSRKSGWQMFQLFLRLGTWQLSDLFYNTVGGGIGGLLYYVVYRVKRVFW